MNTEPDSIFSSQWSSRLVVAGIILVALVGCRSSTDEEEAAAPEREVQVEEPVEARDMSESREVFGLPLPPEYVTINRRESEVRVTTYMSLDDLEAFFLSRVSDHEVLRPGNRIRIVPLRPHLPRAEAFHFGGRNSHIVINYHLPVDIADIVPRMPEPVASDEPNIIVSQQPRVSPNWRDDLQGQPVDLRTPDGDLLAPGARWGESYFPPEGSPLHTERNRPNFGRPFGDWRLQ